MAIEIKSGSTTDLQGITGKKGSLVTPIERDYPGGVGGGHVVAAAPTAVVAAALAAQSSLFAARFNLASARKAYIEEIVVDVGVGAAFTAPGGVLQIVKFSAATPTGGTAANPTRKNSSEGGVSDMGDIRSSNAALTVTGVTFADPIANAAVIGQAPVGSSFQERIPFDGTQNAPLVLQPGEGVALRSHNAIFGATGTWFFGVRMSWFER